jgi:5-methylthioribose kinase
MLDRPPSPYRVFFVRAVVDHLADLPRVREILGGAKRDRRVRDVADGNLNAAFLVNGPQDGACVKQALPYVRVAGESWPPDVKRANYEAAYLARLAPMWADSPPNSVPTIRSCS